MFTKKRMGLIVGLLALAFAALPAIASAAELTDSNGNALEPGATIAGTSTDTVTVTPAGNLECEHVEVFGIVTVNSGGTVLVSDDEEAVSTATGCTFAGSPTIVEPTLTSIHVVGGSGTVVFCFQVLTKEGFKEEFSEEPTEVTYESGSSSIHVTAEVGGFIPGHLSGNFELSQKGEPVIVD